jgi:tRNA-dihydrouridine synthase
VPTDIKQHFLQEAKDKKKQIAEKADNYLKSDYSVLSFDDFMLSQATIINNAEARKKSGQKTAEKFAKTRNWVLSKAKHIKDNNKNLSDYAVAKKIIEYYYAELEENENIFGNEKLEDLQRTVYHWVHSMK